MTAPNEHGVAAPFETPAALRRDLRDVAEIEGLRQELGRLRRQVADRDDRLRELEAALEAAVVAVDELLPLAGDKLPGVVDLRAALDRVPVRVEVIGRG